MPTMIGRIAYPLETSDRQQLRARPAMRFLLLALVVFALCPQIEGVFVSRREGGDVEIDTTNPTQPGQSGARQNVMNTNNTEAENPTAHNNAIEKIAEHLKQHPEFLFQFSEIRGGGNTYSQSALQFLGQSYSKKTDLRDFQTFVGDHKDEINERIKGIQSTSLVKAYKERNAAVKGLAHVVEKMCPSGEVEEIQAMTKLYNDCYKHTKDGILSEDDRSWHKKHGDKIKQIVMDYNDQKQNIFSAARDKWAKFLSKHAGLTKNEVDALFQMQKVLETTYDQDNPTDGARSQGQPGSLAIGYCELYIADIYKLGTHSVMFAVVHEMAHGIDPAYAASVKQGPPFLGYYIGETGKWEGGPDAQDEDWRDLEDLKNQDFLSHWHKGAEKIRKSPLMGFRGLVSEARKADYRNSFGEGEKMYEFYGGTRGWEAFADIMASYVLSQDEGTDLVKAVRPFCELPHYNSYPTGVERAVIFASTEPARERLNTERVKSVENRQVSFDFVKAEVDKYSTDTIDAAAKALWPNNWKSWAEEKDALILNDSRELLASLQGWKKAKGPKGRARGLKKSRVKQMAAKFNNKFDKLQVVEPASSSSEEEDVVAQ